MLCDILETTHHANILFEELEDLEKHGILAESYDLERDGFVFEPSEYATRGIRKIYDGTFSVLFKVKRIFNGSDLKVDDDIMGPSGYGAGTPCP